MRKKLMLVLGLFFLFVPLGLLTNYSAWGEWENEKYKELIGFIPKGIETAKGIKPIIPDYGGGSIFLYYVSAIIGVVMLFWIFYFLAKVNKNVTD